MTSHTLRGWWRRDEGFQTDASAQHVSSHFTLKLTPEQQKLTNYRKQEPNWRRGESREKEQHKFTMNKEKNKSKTERVKDRWRENGWQVHFLGQKNTNTHTIIQIDRWIYRVKDKHHLLVNTLIGWTWSDSLMMEWTRLTSLHDQRKPALVSSWSEIHSWSEISQKLFKSQRSTIQLLLDSKKIQFMMSKIVWCSLKNKVFIKRP